jgi:hypothetical protein
VGNFGVPASKFNGPYNAVDQANEPMMNQVYLIGERTLPTDGSNGVGTRIDLLYGEVGNQDFSLKLGHFSTIVGYEGVPAVGNPTARGTA